MSARDRYGDALLAVCPSCKSGPAVLCLGHQAAPDWKRQPDRWQPHKARIAAGERVRAKIKALPSVKL